MGTQPIAGATMQVLDTPFTSYDAYRAWAGSRPDEEHFDVVGGVPVLTPSPTPAHQLVLYRLTQLLGAVLPSGFVILQAPLDWVLWEAPRLQVRQPDLVVVPATAVRGTHLSAPPVLLVEVLSPGSRDRDLVHKRDEYAQAGLDHYWVVDPAEPRLIAFGRSGLSLVLVAQAVGDETVALDEPFPVTLSPGQLVR